MTENTDQAPGTAERILCPIRGGKQSVRTVERAIELAAGAGGALILLYIVDLDFLGYATVARVRLMAEELAETGRFAMSILADKARALGVEEVEEVVRQGRIQDVITEVAREQAATAMVIGRPVRTPGIPSFTAPAFEKLVSALRKSTGLRIESVDR